MSADLRKHPGGIVLSVHLGVGRVRVPAEHVSLLRDNPQDDEWYEKVADQCWRNARADAIKSLKRTLAAEIAIFPAVVDRRPSNLRKVT